MAILNYDRIHIYIYGYRDCVVVDVLSFLTGELRILKWMRGYQIRDEKKIVP